MSLPQDIFAISERFEHRNSKTAMANKGQNNKRKVAFKEDGGPPLTKSTKNVSELEKLPNKRRRTNKPKNAAEKPSTPSPEKPSTDKPEKKESKRSILLREIISLGGSAEDLDLIHDALSGSEDDSPLVPTTKAEKKARKEKEAETDEVSLLSDLQAFMKQDLNLDPAVGVPMPEIEDSEAEMDSDQGSNVDEHVEAGGAIGDQKDNGEQSDGEVSDEEDRSDLDSQSNSEDDDETGLSRQHFSDSEASEGSSVAGLSASGAEMLEMLLAVSAAKRQKKKKKLAVGLGSGEPTRPERERLRLLLAIKGRSRQWRG
ncbi:hypothetical protein DFS34DRAFT_200747 [Phlyctochytrium arcticum]|nr:hypothetical protein DFS34DRAFT_200747 [Phlyctochytrium arcticum]